MAPKTASALPRFKIPYSPICIATRRRADSETSEASGVEAHVSVQQTNLPPRQLKKATKKRVRKRNRKSPAMRVLITTAKMKDGGSRLVCNKSIMLLSHCHSLTRGFRGF